MNELKKLDDKVYELIQNASDKKMARQTLNYYLYDEGSVLSLLELGITEAVKNQDLSIYDTFEKAFVNECYAKYKTTFGFARFCILAGMYQQFFKIDHHAKSEKHLYVILMSNQSVKIGIAHDVDRRYSQIKASSGMEIIKHWESDLLEDAYVLETKLHKKFKKHRLKGEYFNINYDEAVAQAKEVAMISG